MFQSAIEKDPENPTSYYNLALVHSNLLNWEQAQQFIEQANQLDTGQPAGTTAARQNSCGTGQDGAGRKSTA